MWKTISCFLRLVRVALLHHQKLVQNVNTFLDCDDIVNLHDSMKVWRAFDKNYDRNEVKQLASKFRSVLGDDFEDKASKFDLADMLSPRNVELVQVGSALADFTITQSVWRKLEVGETRTDLVRRITQSIMKRTWHTSPSEAILAAAQSTVGAHVILSSTKPAAAAASA